MGTSIVLIPLIVPMFFYAIFKVMLNPLDFAGIFADVFSGENLERILNLGSEYSEKLIESLAELLRILP